MDKRRYALSEALEQRYLQLLGHPQGPFHAGHGVQLRDQLSSARVAAHHNITLRRLTEFDKLFDDEAAESTIARCRVNAMNFLTDASQARLDQDFDAISLAKLITHPDVRRAVESAEEQWRANDRYQAMLGLRQAFKILINTYEKANSARTPDLFNSRPRGSSAQAARMRTMAQFGSFGTERADHVDRWLQNLDDRVKLLALGVDMRRYAYLDSHTPYRFDLGVGEEPFEVADDAFNRCHRFVVDTALRLAADDFT